MAMALASPSLFPLGLGLDFLIRPRSLELQQSVATERVGVQGKRLVELQVFCLSPRGLSKGSSSSSALPQSASRGEELCLARSVGCGRTGFRGERRTRNGSVARSLDENADRYGTSETQVGIDIDEGSTGESEDFSQGGWVSEIDEIQNNGGANGCIREFIREENGSVIGEIIHDAQSDLWEKDLNSRAQNSLSPSTSPSSASGSPLVGSKEPVYEVFEVSKTGHAVKKLVSRRQLLRTSGLRLRDLRRVDPSLWVTNSSPALLVRGEAILLNLGSLRAIATTQEVLIFDQNSAGAQAFIRVLVPRMNDPNAAHTMPFELEVIESALISRTQRVEQALLNIEPRVLRLLEVLPTCMTADVLEDLRVSKQELVEVGAKAGALRQMLLELLEHPHDIRRMVVLGHVCKVSKEDNLECAVPEEKTLVEDQEEEMEMLLEYYLQRCESCHGQALKLLSSAKEMEDSIGVNLSSRRLEVSRLELLLQVATFCAALGALVAGIFGMNLKSYLEEHVLAFWFTTGGIILGGVALFFYVFNYLTNRNIL